MRVINCIGIGTFTVIIGVAYGVFTGTGENNGVIRFDIGNLSTEQQIAIGSLRDLVKTEATAVYMTGDLFLASILNQGQFNVEASHKFFKEYLEWRDRSNMDKILDEDWSDMRTEFPYSYKTTDKDGKLLLYIDAGDWDICSFLSQGQSSTDRMTRYILMIFEDVESHGRILWNKEQKAGHGFYRFILNAGGISFQKHGCSNLGYFSRDMKNIRTHARFMNQDKIILLNVPSFFRIVYSLFGDQAQNAIQVYGQDQSQWQTILQETIDPDQFPAGIFKEPEQKDNSEGLLHWQQEL